MYAPLAMAPEGSYVVVEEIRAGPGLARRLAELGIMKGVVLRVVKSGPGPVIVERPLEGGSSPSPWRLVLGLGMAMKVLVRVS
ncbi:MAG: ferrous iron transport protein A [Thermoprotei archaeon]|mgnify:CR=1 FL=1|nr:MAG: ferrous iron transport protein A [Thermoprotei archaeon]